MTIKSPPKRARLILPQSETPKDDLLDKYREDYLDESIKCVDLETRNIPKEFSQILPSMEPDKGVLISAGTGAGKSTFVINVLCEFAAGERKRVLIVSNRIALNTQYKNQLIEAIDPDLKKKLTPLGIQDLGAVGNVELCTYHGLRQKMPPLRPEDRPPFGYVVFDEVHFFTADSLFAKDTGGLIGRAVHYFKDCVRIYMTATPWTVQNLLAELEGALPKVIKEAPPHPFLESLNASFGSVYGKCYLQKQPHLVLYRAPEEKKNYQMHFLSSKVREKLANSDLVQLIQQSPVNEKWIIFVTAKSQGEEMAKALADTEFLDASRKSGKLWESLTTHSKFDCRVLISTSVADCGLNIQDDSVRHIALLTSDHTQFIQELGRKRLRKGEAIHVYVPDLSRRERDYQNAHNEELFRLICQFWWMDENQRRALIDAEWYDDTPGASEIRRLIPGRSGRPHINRCAARTVVQRKLFFQKLAEMEEAGEKYPFLRMVCQWLGQPDLSIEDHWCYDDTEACRRQMNEFLKSCVGRELTSKEEKEEFAAKLKELRYRAFGPRKEDNGGRTWGATIIKKELERLQLPFRLEENKAKWILTAVDPPVNDSWESEREVV